MKDDLKLDPYGEVDVDYYIEKAKKQRQQAVAEMFSATGSFIARLVHVKKSSAQKRNIAH